MKLTEIAILIGFLILIALWGVAIVESARQVTPLCKPLPKAVFI